MSDTTPTPEADVPPWILLAGGTAALLVAAGYVATIPLFTAVGAPPTGAQARLEYHAAVGATAWWAIVALSVATDLLLVPVAIGLYAALRRVSPPAMMLATALSLLFVTLDMAVTWPAHASLISLGLEYAAAPSGARPLLVAAASYPAGVLDSLLIAVYSVLTLSLGIMATGIVMLRAGFGRATAAAGVLTGVTGIASLAETVASGSFPLLAVVTTLLTIAWLVLAGRGLLSRGLRT